MGLKPGYRAGRVVVDAGTSLNLFDSEGIKLNIVDELSLFVSDNIGVRFNSISNDLFPLDPLKHKEGILLGQVIRMLSISTIFLDNTLGLDSVVVDFLVWGKQYT